MGAGGSREGEEGVQGLDSVLHLPGVLACPGVGVLKVSHTSAWSDPHFTYCFSALLIWILGGFNFNF